ncbi:MAG: tyrosine-type recombinase/integrase [Lachnospiraceae bacterium]
MQTLHQVKCPISDIFETKVWILFKFGFRRKSKSLDFLRHTFATRCLEEGVDPTNLSSILGHTSSKMTLDVYTDSLLEQRIISMGKIDKLFVYTPETMDVC